MTHHQAIELLTACPFCPSSTIFIEPDEIGSGGQWVAPIHVGCATCKAEQRGDTRGEAIAAWNRRAAPASEPAVDRDADGTLFCQYCESTVGHSEQIKTNDAESKDGIEDWFCCHACRDAGRPCDTYHRIPKDTPAAPEVPAPAAIPDVLFDGMAVFNEVYRASESNLRTSPENVADVLDAVVRLLRAGPAPQGAQAQPEPEMSDACGCRACNPAMVGRWFFVCATCGNKRCPHANDHRNGCTNSNELGQEGSAYA